MKEAYNMKNENVHNFEYGCYTKDGNIYPYKSDDDVTGNSIIDFVKYTEIIREALTQPETEEYKYAKEVIDYLVIEKGYSEQEALDYIVNWMSWLKSNNEVARPYNYRNFGKVNMIGVYSLIKILDIKHK